MTDIVISADAKSAYDAVAQECGFWAPETAGPRGMTIPGHIITQGQIATGGSWYFNYVGSVSVPTGNTISGPRGPMPEYAPLPGVWARLRLNGEISALFQTLVASMVAHGGTVYLRYPIGPVDSRGNATLVWSADGQTPAPAYIDGIGVIA